MVPYCLFTFQSTHDALKAERGLKAAGLSVTVLPVPKDIDSNCGIALGVAPGERARAENCLRNDQVTPEGVYEWKRE